jgi:hypothetical protein
MDMKYNKMRVITDNKIIIIKAIAICFVWEKVLLASLLPRIRMLKRRRPNCNYSLSIEFLLEANSVMNVSASTFCESKTGFWKEILSYRNVRPAVKL